MLSNSMMCLELINKHDFLADHTALTGTPKEKKRKKKSNLLRFNIFYEETFCIKIDNHVSSLNISSFTRFYSLMIS